MVHAMMVVLPTLTTILVVVACQGIESESEVLRNIPSQKFSYIYRDVTTEVNNGGLEDTRYVVKIEFNSAKKPTQVRVRSIKPNGENYSGGEASNGCVDVFNDPSITVSEKKKNYTIRETKGGNVTIEAVFASDTGELNDFSYEHAIEAEYTKGQKGEEHRRENDNEFDKKYFPDNMKLCEDESPSASQTDPPTN